MIIKPSKLLAGISFLLRIFGGVYLLFTRFILGTIWVYVLGATEIVISPWVILLLAAIFLVLGGYGFLSIFSRTKLLIRGAGFTLNNQDISFSDVKNVKIKKGGFGVKVIVETEENKFVYKNLELGRKVESAIKQVMAFIQKK